MPRTAPPRTPSRALPKALAKRDRAARAAKEQSLAEQGFAAIAFVKERQRNIDASFIDIGLALASLKREDVIAAIGGGSWERVCVKSLGMSVAGAEKLLNVATRLRRELALGLGVERASAALAIVDATPADDTVEDILDAPLTLPSGGTLRARTAPTAALWAAAAEFRQAATGAKRRGGKTTTPEERASFVGLQAALRKVTGAKARLVARGTTRGALVRAEFPLAAAEVFGAALAGAKAKKGTPRRG